METDIELLTKNVISSEAQRLRLGNGPIELKIYSTAGRSHDIFLVTLPDGSQMIARVAKMHDSECLERRALHTLNYIKSTYPDCLVPTVHWHNLDQPRDIPPVMIEDLVPGRSLDIWNSTIPKSQQCAFLDSLGQFLLDLWSIKVPATASTSPVITPYSRWLENGIDKGIRRCMAGTANWGKASDYLVMRSMIPQIAHHLDDFSTIGIAHGDMNANNFIVDESLALTGVVDWDWTFEAPLPAVIQYPWFIADVPGWHNSGVEPGETFGHNRNYLVKVIRAKEKESSRGDTVSTLLDQAPSRQAFQSAITYRDIHREFVLSDPVFLEAKAQDIRPQLDSFIKKHPDLRGTQVFEQMMQHLGEASLSS